MTVKELKELLSTLPDNDNIVIEKTTKFDSGYSEDSWHEICSEITLNKDTNLHIITFNQEYKII